MLISTSVSGDAASLTYELAVGAKFQECVLKILARPVICEGCMDLRAVRKVKVEFCNFDDWNLVVIVEAAIGTTIFINILPGVIKWLHAERYLVNNSRFDFRSI